MSSLTVRSGIEYRSRISSSSWAFSSAMAVRSPSSMEALRATEAICRIVGMAQMAAAHTAPAAQTPTMMTAFFLFGSMMRHPLLPCRRPVRADDALPVRRALLLYHASGRKKRSIR